MTGGTDVASPPAAAGPSPGPALVAQSLTTGEIPADTSGDTTDDDLFLNNTASSGMDDSGVASGGGGGGLEGETTFDDSAGYFDEEVIEEDTEEYDEEEIVDDEEMVEEVIDSEHASDHDVLVEEEVVDGAEEEEQADKPKLGQISEAAGEEEEEVVEATEHSEVNADVAGESMTDLPAVHAEEESHAEATVGREPGHASSTSLVADKEASTEPPQVENLQHSASSVLAADQASLQNSSSSVANQLQQGSNHEQMQQNSSSLLKTAGQSTSLIADENQRSTSSMPSAVQQDNSSIANELQGSTTSLMNEPPHNSTSDIDPLSQGDSFAGQRTVDVLPAASTESDGFLEADSPSSKADASHDEAVEYVTTVDDVVASPVSYSRPSVDAQSGIVAESLMVGSAVAVADDAEPQAPSQQQTTGEVRRPPSPKISRSAWLDEEEPSDEGGGRFDEMATVASVPPSVPTINEGDELSGASDHRSVQGATDVSAGEDVHDSLLPIETDLDQSEASKYSLPPAPEGAGDLESSTRSTSSAPAFHEGHEPAPSEPQGLQDAVESSDHMEQVSVVADDQFMSADAPSEHSIRDEAGSYHSQREAVAVPVAYAREPFEEQTESSYVSGSADAVGYGGATEVAGSVTKAEVEEDVLTRNVVESAIEKPQDPMKMFDSEEDESLGDSPRRKLRLTDYALILCILVVFLVLVITLPVVLTNQNKNRDVPTSQPSPSAPTPSPSQYSLVGGPFMGPTGSLLGNAVALYGGLAVAGLPGTTPGSIFTFQKSSSGRSRYLRRGLDESEASWTQATQILQGQESGDMFGWSLNLFNNGMVVGAPGTLANGRNVATGAAYYFELSADSSSWNQVGTVIRGEEDIYAVDELFGSSVAQGGNYRVVVGARNRNGGDGAVYTYALDEASMVWTRIASTGLISNNATREGLGSAIGMSLDGSRMIAGASGANGDSGRVLAYQWNLDSTEWTQVADFPGNPGEYFGASAVSLSVSGDTFAAGGPGVSSWSGVIRVFKLVEGSSEFRQFGPDIIGSEGEGLGSPGSISGSVSGEKVTIFAGTLDGRVHRFESSGADWIETIEPIDTGTSQSISGVSSDDQGSTVLVGSASADAVAVYAIASDVATVPTLSPVSAPSSGSPSPSAISTQPPALTWSLSNSFPSEQGSNLGVSVALVSLLMAAGATSGPGYVNVYQRAGSGWAFQVAINGTEQSSRFGEAVDLNPSDGGLLVGAPGTLAAGTSTSQGAAYYYSFTSSSWTQRGGVIRGDTDVYAANEDFGYSVAVSGKEDLVIGAPRSSVENVIERGRVYTYAFDASSSSWARKGGGGSTVGEAGSDFYGSSVDVSADGGTLIVGAPGHSSGAGAIYIYSWNGSDWVLMSKFSGEASESFGDSVAVLSTNDGSVVAGGGMRSSGGYGIIRVYQLQGGTYAPMGIPIFGSAGDGLGSAKSFSGSADAVVAGTLGGNIKTFAYNPGTGTWDQSPEVISTGASAGLAISGSSTLGSFVAGTSGDVQIFSLVET